MRTYSNYNSELFDPVRLRALAHTAAPKIDAILNKLGTRVVAVTGKSGLAMAVAMLIDIDIVLVRKENEETHGSPIEGSGSEFETYVILDDFVATGSTIKRIMSRVEDTALGQGRSVTCLAVLEYHQYSGNKSRSEGADAGECSRYKMGTAERYYVGA